jgi:uncharacterized protein (DUF885 family)
MLKTALSLFLFISVAQASSEICKPYQFKAQYKNENLKFQDFLDIDWDQSMKESPEFASDLGDVKAAGLWNDDSLESIAKKDERLKCTEQMLKKVKRAQLSKFNQINYDLYAKRIAMGLEAMQFKSHLMPLNQLGGIHTDLIDTLTSMPKQTVEDVENILKRLSTADQKLKQHMVLLKTGLDKKMTPPQVVLSKVVSQFDSILTKSIDDSALYAPFKNLSKIPQDQATAFQKQAREIIQSKLYPELENLRTFLKQTYIPGSRTESVSVQSLPLGDQWYKWAIKYHTTTDLTADQIHEIGLSEVKRITAEMNQIKDKVGFKGTLAQFNKHLLSDSKFFFKKPEELMLAYRNIAKLADAAMPQLFETLPRLTYGVREMPAYKAPTSPTAYYYPGSPELGRAGFFEANTHDLKARPKWGMEALTLHEAVPGHHLQISIAQELKEMPKFRKYSGYTAFGEGWGLYAENLGEEMGFYTDPYSKYGQLSYEMWRAIRLVVDTGLHSKNWTRDQAIDYFTNNMAKSRIEIEVEVDRYIVWPGQALAYKVGQLKFLELRRRAEDKLKAKFNVRKFHDVVLGQGAIPMDLLEKEVNQWIQSQEKTKLM